MKAFFLKNIFFKNIFADGHRPTLPAQPLRLLAWMLCQLVGVVATGLVASFLCFCLVFFSPGGVEFASGTNAQSPALRAQLRANLGLDRPLLVQYLGWLSRAARGDLGRSFLSGQEVAGLIAAHAGPSLILAGAGLGLLLLLSWLLAAAGLAWPWLGRVGDLFILLFFALPSFALGLGLIFIFCVFFRLLPGPGSLEPGAAGLILPLLTLTLSQLAPFLKISRASLAESANEPFVQHAQALGLTRARIYLHLIPKYAITPLLNYLAASSVSLITGAFIIEQVFAWPGLGRLLMGGIIFKDWPLVLPLVFLSVLFMGLCSFGARLASRLINPRLGLEN